jgi:hypothetical protein
LLVHQCSVWSLFTVSALTFAILSLAVQNAHARQAEVFTGIVKGVAVGGYDPVAYFTEGRAIKGSPAIKLQHAGVEWRFSSETNRSLFEADPMKFAPRYGGYCAWAASRGYTAKGDPKAWSIVDGKLYLNYNREVRETWQKDASGNIAKADANWPKVLE